MLAWTIMISVMAESIRNTIRMSGHKTDVNKGRPTDDSGRIPWLGTTWPGCSSGWRSIIIIGKPFLQLHQIRVIPCNLSYDNHTFIMTYFDHRNATFTGLMKFKFISISLSATARDIAMAHLVEEIIQGFPQVDGLNSLLNPRIYILELLLPVSIQPG